MSNKDRISIIREMRDDGKSIRYIAKAMGVSPGTISGIMSRNREIFPHVNQKAPNQKTRDDRRTANALRLLFHSNGKVDLEQHIPQNAKAYDESRLPGLMLHELSKSQCHWALNSGGPFRFCAAPKVGKNYCREHVQRERRVS